MGITNMTLLHVYETPVGFRKLNYEKCIERFAELIVLAGGPWLKIWIPTPLGETFASTHLLSSYQWPKFQQHTHLALLGLEHPV